MRVSEMEVVLFSGEGKCTIYPLISLNDFTYEEGCCLLNSKDLRIASGMGGGVGI